MDFVVSFRKSDTHLAPCILFYGCHALEEDALYTNELRQWQKEGIVDVKFAFSRDIEKSEGCRYAQYVDVSGAFFTRSLAKFPFIPFTRIDRPSFFSTFTEIVSSFIEARSSHS